MIRGTILITLLLIAKSATCQSGYPRIQVPGDTVQDTTVAITRDQMKQVNILHIKYKECSEISGILQEGLDSCISGMNHADSSIANLGRVIARQNQKIEDRDNIIAQAVNMDTEKNKRIKRLVSYNNILKGTTIVTVAVIVLLLL